LRRRKLTPTNRMQGTGKYGRDDSSKDSPTCVCNYDNERPSTPHRWYSFLTFKGKRPLNEKKAIIKNSSQLIKLSRAPQARLPD
jgi:hypothetical protein